MDNGEFFNQGLSNEFWNCDLVDLGCFEGFGHGSGWWMFSTGIT